MQHVVASPDTLQEDRPVILLGNPNVGKSALFGAFTGRRVDVSNYPGTTVEVTRGAMAVGPDSVRLIDTPGVYSLLSALSEDERVTRDVLRDEDPWRSFRWPTAKTCRRTLLLTFQIAEYEMPFILALNMADEARRAGRLKFDYARLAQMLGADVVRTVAVRGEGLEELRAALHAPRPIAYQIRYDGAIEGAVQQIVALLPAAWRGRRGNRPGGSRRGREALPAGSLPAAERAAVADMVAATRGALRPTAGLCHHPAAPALRRLPAARSLAAAAPRASTPGPISWIA